MYEGQTVFSQIIDFMPKYKFRQCVKRYNGNYRTRSFSCYDQFLCMAFAQLTYRESLRDIECCLRALKDKLYHMGIRSKVSKSTLADANEKRDWRIYRDFAKVLIDEARRLYAGEDFGLQLQETIYALDATIIDLCLSVFPWAQFRKTKAAIKLHTLLDLRGNIPSMIAITDGKVHEVNILDQLEAEIGSIYIMDRGYLDFKRLYTLHQVPAFFIIRSKSNLAFRRIYSRPIDKSCGLRCDQIVVLTNYYAKKDYPERDQTNKILRCAYRQSFNFFDQSFSPASDNDCRSLQVPMASENCSSSGSNNICESKSFMAPLKMPSKPKSGLPSVSMFWLPS